MENAIQVKGLKKSFKDTDVLKGVDLEVKRGDIFALLGSNGAGKTTIVKILTTLIKQDGGAAAVNGYDVADKPGSVRQSISLTGQFAAVDEVLTGRENLVMIAKLRHLRNAREAADDLLHRFHLTEAADRRVATYSGGMSRRLDIAMSLIGKPQLIFLDEPTTGLDPEGRIEVWKTIRELAGNGTTVFLTTQYLEEADQLADRIAILHGGRIVAEGTAADLKKMIPHGHVELRFHDGAAAEQARAVLTGYDAIPQEGAPTLSVVTDGSVRQMADILTRLEKAGVQAAEYAQKLPTLEDVFLAIVGEDQERKV